MNPWLKPRKWEFVVNRAYLPFSLSLTCFDTSKKYLDKVLPLPDVEDIYASYKDDLYYGLDGLKIFSETQIGLFKKQGPKFLWRMAELCEQEGNKLIKSARKYYEIDYSKKTNDQIADIFSEFCEQIKTYSVFLNYPWSLETFFDREITEVVSKYEKDEYKALELKKVFSEPIKLNDGQYEQLSLLKIAEEIGTEKALETMGEKIQSDINGHLKKYSWTQMRWLFGKPTSFVDITERIRHSLEEGGISEKVRFLENKSETVRKATDDIVKKFKVEKGDAEFIRLVKEYVFIRTYRSDIINHSLFYMAPILEEFAKRFSITYDDTLYLSHQEILAGLKNRTLSDDIHISERKKLWALFREGDALHILQGDDVTEYGRVQGFSKYSMQLVKEITGQVGYKGKINGTAKVVITPNDIQKVSKGDILVAVMTFPSYIAAMEKASAFVTDEGGILCHAAIIAREMKKPCVISTKIATKVLKDGDLVEVDAERGIVRVIKKAK